VFASLRAELLVLRKSKVAWALVLTAPALTLVTAYLFSFLGYLGDTPAMYAQEGTPAQDLPAMLPSQFVIQAVGSLFFTAPFIVLGAVIAGGDWGRGTIRTSLLAGPGRVRVFAGQAAAILIACAVSVLLCFALAAVACIAIRWYAGPAAPGAAGNGAFPAWSVIGEGVGAGLLVGVAYGALGIALGTICRSAGGGVAAALAWYFLVDDQMYELSLNAGGVFQHIYDAFPEASVVTLTSMFGSSGGGASSQTYQPVGPWESAGILLGYIAVFLGLALVLVLRRDVAANGHARFTWPRSARRRAPAIGQEPSQADGRGAGVLASARAELLVMCRWPAMWAFVLIMPVVTLFDGYLAQYVLYLNAGTSAIVLSSPSQVLPAILPGQYVPAVLNSIGFDPTLPGTAAFFLIGALAAGSSWAGRTITTSLLQAPGRVRTAAGQALAVAVALVASVVLTFAVAGLSTVLIAVTLTGSASPAAGPLPGAARLAAAFGIAVVVSLAWGAAGWTAGTVLKSAAGAFAVMLLWTTIVQVQLDYYATLMPGAARAVYDLLPDAATNTVALLFGQVNYGGPMGGFGEVAPGLAFAILAAYALACFALPVLVTRRRDIL
jgi:ABC-type transport system involved in multi-copper enzyme maturation permease subunit